MKRLWFIWVILCLMLTVTACQSEESTAPVSSSSVETTAAVPEVAYTANVFAAAKLSDDEAMAESGVLHSYLDFKIFISQYRHYFLYGDVARYDEAFFDTHFLIAIPIETASSADRPYVASLTKPRNLSVSIGMHTTEDRDREPWEWLVFVEVSCDDVIKSLRRAEVSYLPIETIDSDIYRTKYPESLERRDISASYTDFKVGPKIDVMPFLVPRLISTYEAFLAHKQELIDHLVFHPDDELGFLRYDEAYFEDHSLIAYVFDHPIQDEYYLKRAICAGDTVTVFIDSHTQSEVQIPASYTCYAVIEIETDGEGLLNRVVVSYW